MVTSVVVVRWKVGWSLVVSEIKPTGFEEKWKRLVGHVNLFEEKWRFGWYRTMMRIMSDFFEENVELVVSVVGLVRWKEDWNW